MKFLNPSKVNQFFKSQVNAKKPFIIPTALGLSYGFFIFIIVIISLNNKNNLIFLFSFFLFSVGLIVMRLTHSNLENITIKYITQSLLFKNDLGFIEFKIENKSKNACYNIEVNEILIDLIPGYSEKMIKIPIKPKNYGQIMTENITIKSTFPFHFLKVWKIINVNKKIQVYPEKINYPSEFLEFHLHNKKNNNVDKENSKMNINDSDYEFSEIKKNQDNEPIHKINWKIYARTEKLYSNLFKSNAESESLKAIYFYETNFLSSFEMRKSQFSYWIFEAYKNKVSFRVCFENKNFLITSHNLNELHLALAYLSRKDFNG